MFDNIINLKNYLKPRIIENLTPGNRSFESNKTWVGQRSCQSTNWSCKIK